MKSDLDKVNLLRGLFVKCRLTQHNIIQILELPSPFWETPRSVSGSSKEIHQLIGR